MAKNKKGLQGRKPYRQALIFGAKPIKKANFPYWGNKETIIPIFFVSILWFLYGGSGGNRTLVQISILNCSTCLVVEKISQIEHSTTNVQKLFCLLIPISSGKHKQIVPYPNLMPYTKRQVFCARQPPSVRQRKLMKLVRQRLLFL